MKNSFVKISSIFFLIMLLASNIVNLHVYFHEQTEVLDHCASDDGHEEDVPCDICILAFNLNNLDYDSTPEFSFKNPLPIQQYTSKEVSNYVDLLYSKFYSNNNRNKAPPHLV